MRTTSHLFWLGRSVNGSYILSKKALVSRTVKLVHVYLPNNVRIVENKWDRSIHCFSLFENLNDSAKLSFRYILWKHSIWTQMLTLNKHKGSVGFSCPMQVRLSRESNLKLVSVWVFTSAEYFHIVGYILVSTY